MRKDVVKKIEQEINEKTKLPDEIKNKRRKEVFVNLMIAILIILYYIFLITGSAGTIKNVRTIDFNIFSILILALAIYLFEVSYRKNSGRLAMFGIESLVVAMSTLFLPYVIFELDEVHKKYYLMISVYIAIYYVIKCIYISIKMKKEYEKQVSDINEIIKKDKKKKIKEEIDLPEEKEFTEKKEDIKIIENKKAKKQTTKTTNKKQENEEDKKVEKNNVKKKTTTKGKNTNKKSVKKTEVKENKKDVKSKEISDLPNNTPKKRGRPKKEETIRKEQENKEINSTPKKRGRPRKVVTNND